MNGTAQFTERYTCPATRRRHKFSKNHYRSVIDSTGGTPEAFRGDTVKFLLHSIAAAIDTTEAKVVIIDNLTYLSRNGGHGTPAVSLMKNLRYLARENGASVLILANAGKRPPDRPIRIEDLAGSAALRNLADSVFAIGRCRHSADIRYIKHLKSRNAPPVLNEQNVAVCRLVRTGSGSDWVPGSALASGRIADGRGESSEKFLTSPNSPLMTHHSPLTAEPFLGFQYLGLYPEADIIADPAKQARRERNNSADQKMSSIP